MNPLRLVIAGAATLVVLLMAALGFVAYRARHQAADPAKKSATVMSLDESAPKLKIAVLGDSLTEGLGLFVPQAYPSLLQKKFEEEGYEVEVINAGLSGDTTAGGLRRLEWVMTPDVKILAIALGGNDALRGLSVKQTHDNLAQIIEKAQAAGVHPLLLGMEGPTNLGEDYRTGFRNIFVDLVREYAVSSVPFLLEGVAGDPELNQADGIHPNAKGAQVLADRLYPIFKQLVDNLNGR